MEVYEPDRLRLVLKSNPRGGISSRLVIDSDWSAVPETKNIVIGDQLTILGK